MTEAAKSSDEPDEKKRLAQQVAGSPPTPNASTPPAVEEQINTDERIKGNWKSRYADQPEALKNIRIDAVIIGSVLVSTHLALLLTWQGALHSWMSWACTSCS